MKKLKDMFLLMALLLTGTQLSAADLDGITLIMREGQKVSFAFAKRPVITTEAENLTITAAENQSVTWPMHNVEKIIFETLPDTPSGISTTKGNARHTVFTLNGTTVCAYGLDAGETLSVHSSDGKVIAMAKASAEGKAIAVLPSAIHAVYIVRTSGGLCYKLAK